jgi:hypothetical protein
MPITRVQQGVIGQNEYAKLVMMGSGGLAEVADPKTDDDRRDAETHVRGKYGFALANQIKTTLRLRMSKGGSKYLVCEFHVRPERIVNNPYFWYFIAHLDSKLMRFADPVFFVPSTVMHTHAAAGRVGKDRHFQFLANMEPKGRDLWVPYRVTPLDLGKRVLEVMEDLSKQQKHNKKPLLSLPSFSPDVVWLRRAA